VNNTDPNQYADMTAAQHNLGYEKIVLGSMLTAPAAIIAAQDTSLDTGDFYKSGHAALYSSILAAQAAGIPTEPHAIAGWLMDRGEAAAAGGLPYLFELVESVPTIANTGHYAEQLVELASRRRTLEALARAAQAGAQGASAERMASIAETGLRGAAPRSRNNGMVCLGEFADIGIRDIEMRTNQARGLMTGFADLDKLLGGLRPGQLIVTAGRPGQGKSTFGLDIARYVSIRTGLVTGFFSMEMTVQELFDRCLSAQAAIPFYLVRDGKLDDRDWAAAARALGPMSEAPLFFNDSTGQTIGRIGNKLRWLQARRGLDLAVLDHLGLITDPSVQRQGRQQEVSKIVREAKELAKQLQIPILALVQLNRDPANRTDKTPQLTDLRESGEIEQSADIVIMIHREDYYDPESPRAGEVDLIVRKNRSGPQDTVTAVSQLHLARFVDMAITA